MCDPVSVVGLTAFIQDVMTMSAKLLTFCSAKTERQTTWSGDRIDSITCRELRLQLEISVGKLEEWHNLWSLDKEGSEDVASMLWGETGREKVVQLLENISSDSNLIYKTFQQLSSLQLTMPERPKSKKGVPWIKLPKLWRVQPTNSKAGSRNDCPALDLREPLTSLAEHVDQICEESELRFRMLHAAPSGNDSIDANLQKAVEAQRLSADVYSFCAESDMPLGLDLNLLNNEPEIDKFPDIFDFRDLRIIYHVLVPHPGPPASVTHVYMQPVSDQEYRPCTACLPVNARKRLKSLVETGEDRTVILGLSREGRETGDPWQVRVVRHTPGKDSQRQIPLASALVDSNQTLDHWLSSLDSDEKKLTAFRVSECGLFLLGTPWLSCMNNKTLRVTQSSNADGQLYLSLETKQTTTSLSMKAESSPQAQIETVGKLLLEIALGTVLHSDRISSKKEMVDTLNRVEVLLGLEYRQACESCFDIRSGASEMLSSPAIDSPRMEEVLRAYYSDVYLR